MASGRRTLLSSAICAITVTIALAAAACSDQGAPWVDPGPPFIGERYDLIAVDGQPLPAAFEFEGYTYTVGASTLAFISPDTLDLELRQLTAVSVGAPNMAAIERRDGYRRPARDSIEAGAQNFGAFQLSPWAYGRRNGDTLTWRTTDPAPSDPHVPDLEGAPFGIHVWRYVRVK